jgi:radical SAM superfamily enzyme YgiQ (UPF0313 family)
MRIVLISPKGPLYRHKGGIFKKSLRYKPLTLTTLAALIPQDIQAEVRIYDEGIETLPDDLRADLIGMTLITGNAPRGYELADGFRKRGIPVVLGGPHVTLLPQEASEHADAICVGYAEQSWTRLLRDFQNGCLKPMYEQGADFRLDADMPFARRELLPDKDYTSNAVFEATRSCVHNCEFCVAPSAWGRKQYQKPVGWVVEDIRRVGAKHNLFVDLNLVSDRAYATELFNALIPLNIRWYGLSTVIIAHDRELMELMARSGCKGLLLGLESLSRESLADTKKSFNAKVDYRKFITDLHQLGISIQGCFVFGLDSDTKHVFKDTVEFAIECGVDLPRFALLTPFPNTPLYKRLDAEGRILTRNWELYDAQHVVFQPKNMSVQELNDGHEYAWKAVYKYSAIARRMMNARKFSPILVAANLGYRFYANRLKHFYNCDWNIPGK